MALSLHTRWSSRLGLAVTLVLLPALLLAADRRVKAPKPGESSPENVSVDLFGAIEKGEIDVKLIPKDSTQCKVLITNKTDKPLSVKLPAAFAGVPVLGQIGNQGIGGNNNLNNQAQAMGGGMGMGMPMGMGGMGMGGMGGFMNIAPERVGQLKVPTVCLEHGKAEPRAQIKYEIRPIESFTNKTGVQELCAMLGTGQINQRAAQAAAWHLNNNMSWEQLAAKRLSFANGTSQPYFSPQEIQAAMQLSAAAVQVAEKRQQQESTESASVSQQ